MAPLSGLAARLAARPFLLSSFALAIGMVAVACGGTDEESAPAAPVATATTAPPTAVPTAVPTPYVRMPAPDGCAPSSPGELHDAYQSPASPYLVRHPAASSPESPTVIFFPGGQGQRRHAERVWERYLSNGDGVDEFRFVVPYAEDFDLEEDSGRFMKIVDEVLACHGGDPAKVHLAGFSNGGHIAFDLMVRKADRFASLLGAPGEFAAILP
ncbi:MAG: hypothetical protein O3C10_03055, partial [Chloroflexi bacterium]|nr:hypothetical protein [Chloroflexota bacterium]